MASSHHVEMEAAKFLQKLIQDSKDEPAKLATKLLVICQHMKLRGKEQSLPYQVISRAMETVIIQHGLDMEALKSSRIPLSAGSQIGDPGSAKTIDKEAPDNTIQAGAGDVHFRTTSGAWHAGSSSMTKEVVHGGYGQSVGALKDSKSVLVENEGARQDAFSPNMPLAAPSRVENPGHDFYQGPGSQRNNNVFEHESPSSLDTRSANSRDTVKVEKQGQKKDNKKASAKRKRADSVLATDPNSDHLQQSDTPGDGSNQRKGKVMNRGDMQGHFAVKGVEHVHANAAQNSGNMEHIASLSSGTGSIFRAKQENQNLFERTMSSQVSSSMPLPPTSKNIEEAESSVQSAAGLQKGVLFPPKHDVGNSGGVWDQFKMGLPPENSQFSRFAPNVSSGSTGEISMHQLTTSSLGASKEAINSGNEMKNSFHGDKNFELSGQSSEGTSLGKAGKFWPQSVNSNALQGIAGVSSGIGKFHGGMPGMFNQLPMANTGFSTPAQFNSSLFDNRDLASKIHKERGAGNSHLLDKDNNPSATRVAVDSEHRNTGFLRDAESGISAQGMEVHMGSINRGEETSAHISARKALEHDGGTLHKVGSTFKMIQRSGSQGPQSRYNPDMGKVSSQASSSMGLPFREQQLKQLRAQCLVFLAFRNGLVPRKLHLEIALGDNFPKEGGNADGACREQNDHKGKELSLRELAINSEATGASGRSNDKRETENAHLGSSSTGALVETETSKDIENSMNAVNRKDLSSDQSALAEERKRLLAMRRKSEAESQPQEAAESQVALNPALVLDSMASEVNHERDDKVGKVNKVYPSILSMNRQQKPEINSFSVIASQSDAAKDTIGASMFQHESVAGKIDGNPSQAHTLFDGDRVNRIFRSVPSVLQSSQHADKYPSVTLKEQLPPIPGKGFEHSRDVNVLPGRLSCDENQTDGGFVGANCGLDHQKISDSQQQCLLDGCKLVAYDDALKDGSPVLEKSADQEEEYKSGSNELPPSPKYTTSEKWIMDYHKKKLLEEKNWVVKQRKTEERIAVCFNKLKETVSSSENTSAKTKSVIELKKLQLLQLQRRLRSEFLHDFFKPIASEMERLKSIKKHRHGRRLKQLEKFEQKMKDERLKRIRERQKEFFSEIEVHKERLEDWFKIRRERWKGFNRYVKEFHKRKERIHREKIDRIQREKINLLKNNDVEGYLRMVQDAKSDRVKQLLKETEKYLQKLGSKLQDAKAMARRFEMEMDENRAATVVEKNEVAIDNEDESDQAEHYLESNEKYYMMAHSIKESITEQPISLQGGKLREYQMNGLRWLVSLYNNHLNGILADEMGLGKTVQVIALICYLMETKNDRGPFLVVVPSSVLPGWESEISFWAPGINKIAYAGPPEERRRLFKERIVHQKFNVLLTTYEYLMNKHDRPKLSKVHWHYIIIDEGHRIKNASCKLNADLKHYQSAHRLLLTGTPLQNNLEELWALLNFLLPNLFNSSEDFSQWFNKPFESNGDTSPDEALLSEEENLLIINRLHQVLRPFVLRRLKQKVENELPEKIERLVRCEASAYQKLLMKRVEANLGSLGNSRARAVHNTVMELRNICNHPYLSQLHAEEVDSLIPRHYLPPIVRLCGKLEMLDRLLPKLKATDHRVLFFSTMTRLLDVMEEYLRWKRYGYLRLDGHTSGSDRGALIEEFNRPDSPAFIFLLSIRAGGVGVNLQAADTVIIFDTDWNPQVDLQAQARAHRIGQKKDVLVLRLETVRTVEEQVRAAAEHKLGVANQSITAGFFDNNTSAEDRREYLESLLRESKKEEAAPVLDDDALNDILARSESEIDIFELVDEQRREAEMSEWQRLVCGADKDNAEPLPAMPSRLVTDDDLAAFYKAMQLYEESNVGVKRKNEYLGGLDTQQYGRGKRAREVRSYEDQWTEEEFEKMCQADSPDSPKPKEENKPTNATTDKSESKVDMGVTEQPQTSLLPPPRFQPSSQPLLNKDLQSHQQPQPQQPLPPQAQQQPQAQPPSRRGRGRPKRVATNMSPSAVLLPGLSVTVNKLDVGSQKILVSSSTSSGPDTQPGSTSSKDLSGATPSVTGSTPGSSLTPTPGPSISNQGNGQGRKTSSGLETPRRRGKKSAGLQAVGPETNSISRIPKDRSTVSGSSAASAFGQDKHQLVNRTSGTSNLSTYVTPLTSELSRIPGVISMSSDASSTSAFAQDKQSVARRSGGTSSAPTIVSFEVNPISGLRQVVELVRVKTPIPAFAQEKYKSIAQDLDRKETENAAHSSETKVVPSEATPAAKNESGKLSVTQSSTPGTSALAQGLMERRTLRMGASVMSGKQKLTEKPEDVEKGGPGFDPSKIGAQVITSGDSTGHLGLPIIKPVEFASSQDNVQFSIPPGSGSQDMNNKKSSVSSRQTRSSAEKKNRAPAGGKRGPKKKNIDVSTNKPSIPHPSSLNMIDSARPVSLGSSNSDNKVTVAVNIGKEKREADARKLENVSGKPSEEHAGEKSGEKSIGPEKSDALDQKEQQKHSPPLQKSAVMSMDHPSHAEPNEIQPPLKSREELLPLEVGSSQNQADTSSQVEPSQAAEVSSIASVEKVSLATYPVEATSKEPRNIHETNAQESRSVHSEPAGIIMHEATSTQEPSSIGDSGCSAQSRQQSVLSTFDGNANIMDENSPCQVTNEIKAPPPVMSDDDGKCGTVHVDSEKTGEISEVHSSTTKISEPLTSKDHDILDAPVKSDALEQNEQQKHSPPLQKAPVKSDALEQNEQQKHSPPLQKGAVISMGHPAHAEQNEIQPPLKSREELLPLEVGSSQNHADTSSQVELSQAAEVSSIASVEKVSLAAFPVESTSKEPRNIRETNTQESRSVHSKPAGIILHEATSTQEPSSTGDSGCSAQSRQQSVLSVIDGNANFMDKNSPRQVTNEIKAPPPVMSDDEGKCGTVHVDSEKTGEISEVHSSTTKISEPLTSKDHDILDAPVKSDALDQNEHQKHSPPLQESAVISVYHPAEPNETQTPLKLSEESLPLEVGSSQNQADTSLPVEHSQAAEVSGIAPVEKVSLATCLVESTSKEPVDTNIHETNAQELISVHSEPAANIDVSTNKQSSPHPSNLNMIDSARPIIHIVTCGSLNSDNKVTVAAYSGKDKQETDSRKLENISYKPSVEHAGEKSGEKSNGAEKSDALDQNEQQKHSPPLRKIAVSSMDHPTHAEPNEIQPSLKSREESLPLEVGLCQNPADASSSVELSQAAEVSGIASMEKVSLATCPVESTSKEPVDGNIHETNAQESKSVHSEPAGIVLHKATSTQEPSSIGDSDCSAQTEQQSVLLTIDRNANVTDRNSPCQVADEIKAPSPVTSHNETKCGTVHVDPEKTEESSQMHSSATDVSEAQLSKDRDVLDAPIVTETFAGGALAPPSDHSQPATLSSQKTVSPPNPPTVTHENLSTEENSAVTPTVEVAAESLVEVDVNVNVNVELNQTQTDNCSTIQCSIDSGKLKEEMSLTGEACVEVASSLPVGESKNSPDEKALASCEDVVAQSGSCASASGNSTDSTSDAEPPSNSKDDKTVS